MLRESDSKPHALYSAPLHMQLTGFFRNILTPSPNNCPRYSLHYCSSAFPLMKCSKSFYSRLHCGHSLGGGGGGGGESSRKPHLGQKSPQIEKKN